VSWEGRHDGVEKPATVYEIVESYRWNFYTPQIISSMRGGGNYEKGNMLKEWATIYFNIKTKN
jgi:hypothetical protein